MTANKKMVLRFDVGEVTDEGALPALLHAAQRGGSSVIDPLLDGVKVTKTLKLSSATRGAPGATSAYAIDGEAPPLLALQAEDGATYFMRADALAEDIARRRPEAVKDGEVVFSDFRDPSAASRGAGELLWKAVSIISMPADGLIEQAADLALEWAKEKLGEKLEDTAYGAGSFLLAKALMWKIESRLAGRPGLYCWNDNVVGTGDHCLDADPRLSAAAKGMPMLVMIHGIASYTTSAFQELREDDETWSALTAKFKGGIFGYEHRTFSQSPIENALELVRALPTGARVSLLTHNRGGLVGDLLALGQVEHEAIEEYKFSGEGLNDPDGLEREAREERGRLIQLIELLKSRDIQIQRYVRVACPARGTRFFSDNLDAALSDFLNLVQWGGSALTSVIAGAVGGPVAAERFGQGASSALGVLKRLVLEIANRRLDPQQVPGIAALCVSSPLASFLADPRVRRRDGVDMAVIAGDTEFDGLGFSNLGRRVANLFCDWRLFDRNDNDMVVDTDSMFAGLGFREGTRYLYDQDSTVTHFRYFRNRLTRHAARNWLVAADCAKVDEFQPLSTRRPMAWREREAQQRVRGATDAKRPVVILIPDFMGSHIELKTRISDEAGSGERIWFDVNTLVSGKFGQLSDCESALLSAEDIWERYYADLADHLAASHNVVRCAYDWRKSIRDCAQVLASSIDKAMTDNSGQPLRLLAHGMGGLVARHVIHANPDLWRRIIGSGGRLIMLGTPNSGSHLIVHALLGKTDAMRLLERLDHRRDLQQLLDVVAGFEGALHLLPRPDFAETADGKRIAAREYYVSDTWKDLKARNDDRWYGKQICALPDKDLLKRAQAFWQGLPADEADNAEGMAYVFGQADCTPCGVVRVASDKLQLLYTAEGDGAVTWASGKIKSLEDGKRCWYMPVSHADLTDTPEYFPAIVDLLAQGSTGKLSRLPVARSAGASSFVRDAGPPIQGNDEEVARALLGGGSVRRRRLRGKQVLKVSVRAGDLRFIDQPVMCGHYIGDPISGAEATLDSMLEGRLSERQRLGLYANEVGTSSVVLKQRSEEERFRGSRPGALIVGLGDFNGQLATRQITQTVQAGVLRYLILLRDSEGLDGKEEVQLSSLLIGGSSTAHISIHESVAAITLGVLEANRQFCDALEKAPRPGIPVSSLAFIELYKDTAISATHAVRDLNQAIEQDLKRLRFRVEPNSVLIEGKGVRERLSVDNDFGYWARLIVTDPDAADVECPPECYEVRTRTNVPAALLRKLCGHQNQPCDCKGAVAAKSGTDGDAAAPVADASPVQERYYPDRLKYVFLSPRARAESVFNRRQPGLIEGLIATQREHAAYNLELGHTLFHLMVPLDFKAAARERSRLLLVLDAYTAAFPWELMQVDGTPLVLRTPVVRQLITTRYRPSPRVAGIDNLCIIVAPSTAGFNRRFGGEKTKLIDLPAAAREGENIRDIFKPTWNITYVPKDTEALDIFNKLYVHPYRILVIAAHGVFEMRGKDGRAYTGVVLSDGLLITAAEVALMETVPEIVYLSACHQGSMSSHLSEPNRLAYSLARELIEMGVRCVVAAGWQVDDEAACTFATEFFARMYAGSTFGDAVFKAREETYASHANTNTWGAYQVYGSPDYRLKPSNHDGEGRDGDWVSPSELIDSLRWRRTRNARIRNSEAATTFKKEAAWIHQQLRRGPDAWHQRADVLMAIGEIYSDLGQPGWDAARTAYERALQAVEGQASLVIVEQLANVEARLGARVAEKESRDQGRKLILSAIERINRLLDLSGVEGERSRHPERAAILGSAYKRLALVPQETQAPWNEVKASLSASAAAYESAVSGDPWQLPYNTLNSLVLRWLVADENKFDTAYAHVVMGRCAEEARKQFAKDKAYWNATMPADAEVAKWLVDPASRLDGTATKVLAASYRQALDSLPTTARESDSIVTHLAFLACMCELRKRAGDIERAKVLRNLVMALAPERAASQTKYQATFADATEAPPPPASTAKSAAKKPGRRKTNP